MPTNVTLYRTLLFLFVTLVLTVNNSTATHSNSEFVYVKITYHSKGYPIAKFTINNKKSLLIIDTGAPCTQLDKSEAENIGLRWKDTGTEFAGTSFSFTGKSYYTFVSSMKYDNVELWHNFHLASINLSFVNAENKHAEEPVVGILGLDILRKYKGIIDLETSTIRLQITK